MVTRYAVLDCKGHSVMSRTRMFLLSLLSVRGDICVYESCNKFVNAFLHYRADNVERCSKSVWEETTWDWIYARRTHLSILKVSINYLSMNLSKNLRDNIGNVIEHFSRNSPTWIVKRSIHHKIFNDLYREQLYWTYFSHL